MVKTLDLLLPMAEFEYNSSINRTTGSSPIEIVLGLQPRKPIDLVPLPISTCPSGEVNAFTDHIRYIHADPLKNCFKQYQLQTTSRFRSTPY